MHLYKYHCCNNTFLITNFKNNIDYSKIAKQVCELYMSDGLIIFKNDPMKMIIYNKDGSRAKMCGNGLCTLVNYLYDMYGMYLFFEIETDNGVYGCEIISISPFKVKISLGIGEEYLADSIKIDNDEYKIILFDLGVKHAIYISADFDNRINDAIKIFEYYKGEYNVDIVKVIDNKTFNILTYEKGVGLTKSCGTGTGASAFALLTEMNMNNKLKGMSSGGITDVIIDDNIYIINETNFIERYII